MAVGYVDPPRSTRRRKSSVPEHTVQRMAELMEESARLEPSGRWVSDQQTYTDRKKAVGRSQAFRRVVAETMGLDVRMVKTRVWEQNGQWTFALKKDIA